MDEHTPGLKRRYTDAELRTHTVTELMDLAGDCDIEPADPTICDACAAYLIAHEKEDADQATPEEQDKKRHWDQGYVPIGTWSKVLEERDVAEAMVGRLTEKLGEATIAVARFAEKPWLFMPGDRVVVLLGNKMEGGTVRQIRIPGPIRDENVVQVELDEVPFHGLGNSLWFNPDQVERLG